jgi:hypothetical protein
MPPSLILVAIMLAIQPAGAAAAAEVPIWGPEAEEFLTNAKVVEVKDFKTKGVTRPQRAVLSDGERTARAVFKNVDEYKPSIRLGDGTVVMRFKDRYHHEIAAYEVDKLLGTRIVPACVERRILGDTGALCMWIEDAMTEWDRREKGIEAPDMVDWNRQLSTVRLFLQLVYDIDFKNVANILIDESFHIYKIDSSRAFRTDKKLPEQWELTQFSRSVLDALRGLTQEQASTQLKPWLSKNQIKGLMARRDALLALADEAVAERGEDAVLFP